MASAQSSSKMALQSSYIKKRRYPVCETGGRQEKEHLPLLSGKGADLSMGITQETRREAYQDIQMAASNRRRLIYTTLRKRGPMTAEELADTLGFSDKNSVRPRLTELKALRLVGVIDKRKARSGKKTAVWAALEEGKKA